MSASERPRKPAIVKLPTVPEAGRTDHAGRVLETTTIYVGTFGERPPAKQEKRDEAKR